MFGSGAGAGGGVNIGTIYAFLNVAGYEEAAKKLKEFEAQAKTTGQKTSSAMSEMTSSIMGSLAQFAAAIVSTQQIVKGFQDVLQEEEAYTRLEVSLERMGVKWADVGGRVRGAIEELRDFGKIGEEQIAKQLQRMVTITGDLESSLNLVRLAVIATKDTGTDFEQVMSIFARGMSGAQIRASELTNALNLNVAALREGENRAVAFTRVIDALRERYSGKDGLTKVMQTNSEQLKELSTLLKEVLETVLKPVLQIVIYFIRGLKAVAETIGIVSVMVEDFVRMMGTIIPEVMESLSASFWDFVNPLTAFRKIKEGFQAIADAIDFWWDMQYKDIIEGRLQRLEKAWQDVFQPPEVKIPVVGEISVPPVQPAEEKIKESKEKIQESVKDIKEEIKDAANETNRYLESAAGSLANYLANSMVNFQFSMEGLLNIVKSIIAQIMADILRTRIMQFLMSIYPLFAGRGGGGQFGVDYWGGGGMNVAGFVPPTPPSGGSSGITVQFENNTQGSIMRIFKGNSLAEQRQFAFQIYRLGLQEGVQS